MRICIVTPARRGTRYGNRVTAERWRRILRGLGHRVTVADTYRGEAADVLIALHARRSHGAIMAFHKRYPARPILVALTGTDIYGLQAGGREALKSLALATRIIALQHLAAREIPARYRAKVRVILQSFARKRTRPSARARTAFQVAVVGHLRDVKDPLRAALAVRDVPAESRLRVVQAGSAMDAKWAGLARAERRRNPRYEWLGNLTAAGVARLMRASDVLVVSSRSEGGANVISEAIGLGLPVIASRVPGNVGLLGSKYPGYFKVANTKALQRLLSRAEREKKFRGLLRSSVLALVPTFEPAAERGAWRHVLKECVSARKSPESSHARIRRAGVFGGGQGRKSTL